MKQRILLSIVTIFASITALYGQMDSWMLNQWLNQMNMDTYQQQQKIFQDFQNLVKEEAKRQDANATAVCVLLPGGGDTFFAHIQTVYISHSRIEIIDRDEDGYETRVPSSSYSVINGQILTQALFKPGHSVIIRRKDNGKALTTTRIPRKGTDAYESFLRNAQIASQHYNNTSNGTYSNGGSTTTTSTKQCSLCKGKGWIAGSSTPTYGNTSSYWCEECSSEVNASHSHDRCPSCGGKGYISR